MSNNSVYVGSEAERQAIAAAVESQRAQTPAVLANHQTVASEMRSNAGGIDWELFARITSQAETYFRNIDPHFSMIPPDRYYVTHPESGNLGGFFGKPVGGYYYLDDVGFTTYLDADRVPNATLRTLEFARNYIHDSMHASTFKTIRIDPETGKHYRHQYGINFRDAQNNSYSAPNLHETNPDAINLNYWMDAVTHAEASKFLSTQFPELARIEGLTPLEQQIANEARGVAFDRNVFPESKSFYAGVIDPVKKFMSRWGGESQLTDMTMKAMFSGDQEPVKDFFASKLGRPDAFESLFRQEAYREPPPVRADARAVSNEVATIAEPAVATSPEIPLTLDSAAADRNGHALRTLIKPHLLMANKSSEDLAVLAYLKETTGQSSADIMDWAARSRITQSPIKPRFARMPTHGIPNNLPEIDAPMLDNFMRSLEWQRARDGIHSYVTPEYRRQLQLDPLPQRFTGVIPQTVAQATNPTEILQTLLKHNQGVAIADQHGDYASVEELTAQLRNFREQGGKVLFMEMVRSNFQDSLDAYMQTGDTHAKGSGGYSLEEAGLNNRWDNYAPGQRQNYFDLIQTARAEGIEVVGIDTVDVNGERFATSNDHWADIVAKRAATLGPGEKFIVFGGKHHFAEGVETGEFTGATVSDRLKIPTLEFASDAAHAGAIEVKTGMGGAKYVRAALPPSPRQLEIGHLAGYETPPLEVRTPPVLAERQLPPAGERRSDTSRGARLRGAPETPVVASAEPIASDPAPGPHYSQDPAHIEARIASGRAYDAATTEAGRVAVLEARFNDPAWLVVTPPDDGIKVPKPNARGGASDGKAFQKMARQHLDWLEEQRAKPQPTEKILRPQEFAALFSEELVTPAQGDAYSTRREFLEGRKLHGSRAYVQGDPELARIERAFQAYVDKQVFTSNTPEGVRYYLLPEQRLAFQNISTTPTITNVEAYIQQHLYADPDVPGYARLDTEKLSVADRLAIADHFAERGLEVSLPKTPIVRDGAIVLGRRLAVALPPEEMPPPRPAEPVVKPANGSSSVLPDAPAGKTSPAAAPAPPTEPGHAPLPASNEPPPRANVDVTQAPHKVGTARAAGVAGAVVGAVFLAERFGENGTYAQDAKIDATLTNTGVASDVVGIGAGTLDALNVISRNKELGVIAVGAGVISGGISTRIAMKAGDGHRAANTMGATVGGLAGGFGAAMAAAPAAAAAAGAGAVVGAQWGAGIGVFFGGPPGAAVGAALGGLVGGAVAGGTVLAGAATAGGLLGGWLGGKTGEALGGEAMQRYLNSNLGKSNIANLVQQLNSSGWARALGNHDGQATEAELTAYLKTRADGKALDANHDGKISGAELQALMQRKGDTVDAVLRKEIGGLIGQMNSTGWSTAVGNHDGKATVEEVMATLKGHKITLQSLDKNNDGHVSGVELQRGFEAAGIRKTNGTVRG